MIDPVVVVGVMVQLLASAPTSAASPGGPAPWLATPHGWEANLAPSGEPGGRFVMEGRFVDAKGARMAGLKVYVYHADSRGLYAEKGALYPRLAGVLRTDARGRYRIQSALPGQYGGPPHVHFEAWRDDLRLRTWFVNLYRGPKEKPDSTWGRMGVRRGQPAPQPPRPGEDPAAGWPPPPPETNVTRDRNAVFHASCDLRWDVGFDAGAHADSSRRGLVEP